MTADIKAHIAHIRACHTCQRVLLGSIEIIDDESQDEARDAFDMIVFMSSEIGSELDKLDSALKSEGNN